MKYIYVCPFCSKESPNPLAGCCREARQFTEHAFKFEPGEVLTGGVTIQHFIRIASCGVDSENREYYTIDYTNQDKFKIETKTISKEIIEQFYTRLGSKI